MKVEVGRPYSRLAQRLLRSSPLSDADLRALSLIPMAVQHVRANEHVVRAGERSIKCCLILEGYLCRCKLTHEAKRQIMSFHIAGDIPDLQSLHLPTADHDLIALGPTIVASIPHEPLQKLQITSVPLLHALWRDTLVDAAIYREWVVNLGRRDALARVAHLVCELFLRLQVVGLVHTNSYVIPWTQVDIADACGMSVVHANRVIQELRRLRLADIGSRHVEVMNWSGLRDISGFSSDYLHLAPA